MKVFTTDNNKDSKNSSKVGRLSNYYIEPDIIWLRIIFKEKRQNFVKKNVEELKIFFLR